MKSQTCSPKTAPWPLFPASAISARQWKPPSRASASRPQKTSARSALTRRILRLLEHGSRPHFIAYYALVMALQGRPWNDCKGKEKDALRERFDALKEASKGVTSDAALDRALAEIGVLPAGQRATRNTPRRR